MPWLAYVEGPHLSGKGLSSEPGFGRHYKCEHGWYASREDAVRFATRAEVEEQVPSGPMFRKVHYEEVARQ